MEGCLLALVTALFKKTDGYIKRPMINHEHEALVSALKDPKALDEYKKPYDAFHVGFIPRILGKLLVGAGAAVYGEAPSYGKFKAVEVIARIPYQSWEVMSYMLLTIFYSNEGKAIELSRTSYFSHASQDNETMHVVVLSDLARKYGQDSIIRHTMIPLFFSFFYFVSSSLLYLFHPRSALELNYLFESHAFSQYDRFLDEYGEEMKGKAVKSNFLEFYGRHVESEYDLFVSIRSDEIIHRNASAKRAEEYRRETSRHRS